VAYHVEDSTLSPPPLALYVLLERTSQPPPTNQDVHILLDYEHSHATIPSRSYIFTAQPTKMPQLLVILERSGNFLHDSTMLPVVEVLEVDLDHPHVRPCMSGDEVFS
jgi:hypothetical protein